MGWRFLGWGIPDEQQTEQIIRGIVLSAALVVQFNTVAGPAVAGFRVPVSPYAED
jgi:hypothetical protein